MFVGGHSKHEDYGSQYVMGHEDNASQIGNVQIEPDERNRSLFMRLDTLLQIAKSNFWYCNLQSVYSLIN